MLRAAASIDEEEDEEEDTSNVISIKDTIQNSDGSDLGNDENEELVDEQVNNQ